MTTENRSQASLENLTTKVDDLTTTVTDLTHAVQDGFANNERKFDVLFEGQENIKERLTSVEQGLSKLTVRVEDMADTLESTASMASDHEGRITHLEKAVA